MYVCVCSYIVFLVHCTDETQVGRNSEYTCLTFTCVCMYVYGLIHTYLHMYLSGMFKHSLSAVPFVRTSTGFCLIHL